MKKVMIWTFVAFLAAAGFASESQAAADRSGTWDAGFNVSHVDVDDNSYDSAVYYGGTLAYGLSEWFAIGVEAGRFESDAEMNASELGVTTVNGGELKGMPVLADLIVRFNSVSDSFDPYAVVGLGMVFWDIQNVSGDLVPGTPYNIDFNVDDSFAVKVGGGIDWFLSENWILNFEGAYVFADSDVNATITAGGVSASVAQSAELDYWTVGGGIKYKF